jgi:hypothetical protein
MTDAEFFRRQAAKCATLAKQTHDEEGRQRYLRLEQTYLHLAESEDQPVGQMNTFARARRPHLNPSFAATLIDHGQREKPLNESRSLERDNRRIRR